MVFQKNPSTIREEIVWNGKTYRRYPNAKQSAHRRYFSCAGSFLHRDVWIKAHGKVPDGFHIHHKDGNPANNDINNLECISSSDHFALHSEERSMRAKTPKHLAFLGDIRPKTAEWHRSEEGRAWHRQHAKASLEKARLAPRFSKKPDLVKNCHHCGKEFTTRNVRKIICGVSCESKRKRAKKKAELANLGNSGDKPLYPV